VLQTARPRRLPGKPIRALSQPLPCILATSWSRRPGTPHAAWWYDGFESRPPAKYPPPARSRSFPESPRPGAFSICCSGALSSRCSRISDGVVTRVRASSGDGRGTDPAATAREIETEQDKLMERARGQRLDTGTTGATTNGNAPLEVPPTAEGKATVSRNAYKGGWRQLLKATGAGAQGAGTYATQIHAMTEDAPSLNFELERRPRPRGVTHGYP
jgi:hypothetical protein